MGPNVETVENKNVATPLAEDIVQILQGELSEGAFGLGPGPQQRRAGTSLEQFISTLETRLGDPNRISPLEEGSMRRTNRAAADQREAFGAAGNRYGSSLGNAEALLRAESGANLDQLAFQQEGFDTKMLLEGIAQLFGQGQQSRALDLSALLGIGGPGVNQPETITSPGLGETLLGGILGLGTGYLQGRN